MKVCLINYFIGVFVLLLGLYIMTSTTIMVTNFSNPIVCFKENSWHLSEVVKDELCSLSSVAQLTKHPLLCHRCRVSYQVLINVRLDKSLNFRSFVRCRCLWHWCKRSCGSICFVIISILLLNILHISWDWTFNRWQLKIHLFSLFFFINVHI